VSSRITWNQFYNKLINFKPELISPTDPSIFNIKDAVVKLTCAYKNCGNPIITHKPRDFWLNRTESCGCYHLSVVREINKSKKTFKDVHTILAKDGLTLLSTESDDAILHDLRVNGKYRFKCSCGNEFGSTTNLQSVIYENTKSCGCRGKTTCQDLVNVISQYGMTIKEPFEGFVASTEKISFICKCKKEFKAQVSEVKRHRNKSCGCKINIPKRPNLYTGSFDKINSMLLKDGAHIKDHFDGYIGGEALVICICNCGREFKIPFYRIKNYAKTGVKITCGCGKAEGYKARYTISLSDLNSQLAKYGSRIKTDFVGKIASATQISCICKCGREFKSTTGAINRGFVFSCGCLTSMAEINLFTFVKTFCVDAIKNSNKTIKAVNGARRQLDVYIPSKNLAIELDGVRWHGEAFRNKKDRDKLGSFEKYLLCKDKSIRLFTFFDDEWFNKREAVENYIKGALSDINIDAAKCEVLTGGSEFINSNCLQSVIEINTSISHVYSLEYMAKVVAAAAFSRKSQDESYELTQYCVGDILVQGALSKLMAYFWKTHPDAKCITSYSDNRFSDSKAYQDAGFNKLNDIDPTYWYVIKNKLQHRFNYSEDALAARGWLLPNETEWACMQRLGHDRVWDCGKIKWGLERPDLKVATRSESSNYII
jgi:hypothetical protein